MLVYQILPKKVRLEHIALVNETVLDLSTLSLIVESATVLDLYTMVLASAEVGLDDNSGNCTRMRSQISWANVLSTFRTKEMRRVWWSWQASVYANTEIRIPIRQHVSMVIVLSIRSSDLILLNPVFQ